MNCPHCGKSIEKKTTLEKASEFSELKDYLMQTWKLRNSEYPFTSIDAGILKRLLHYGLPMAKGLMDFAKDEIRSDPWVYERMGMTLKALEFKKAKLLDDSRLKSFIQKHEPRLELSKFIPQMRSI